MTSRRTALVPCDGNLRLCSVYSASEHLLRPALVPTSTAHSPLLVWPSDPAFHLSFAGAEPGGTLRTVRESGVASARGSSSQSQEESRHQTPAVQKAAARPRSGVVAPLVVKRVEPSIPSRGGGGVANAKSMGARPKRRERRSCKRAVL